MNTTLVLNCDINLCNFSYKLSCIHYYEIENVRLWEYDSHFVNIGR